MKKILLLTISLFAGACVFAQKLPVIMATPFSYRECYPNHPDKKNRYCRESKFTIAIAGDSLVITETRGTKVEQPKKAEYFDAVYRVHLKDIQVNNDINKLSGKGEKSSIKDLESNTQYFYRFNLTTNGPKIMGPRFGKYVGVESIALYSNSLDEAKDFLLYLTGMAYGR